MLLEARQHSTFVEDNVDIPLLLQAVGLLFLAIPRPAGLTARVDCDVDCDISVATGLKGSGSSQLLLPEPFVFPISTPRRFKCVRSDGNVIPVPTPQGSSDSASLMLSSLAGSLSMSSPLLPPI